MNFWGIVLMTAMTIIGLKYLTDMIKFAKGYEIHGKRRYPKSSQPVGKSNNAPAARKAA